MCCVLKESTQCHYMILVYDGLFFFFKIKYLSKNMIKCEFIFATQPIHNFTFSKLIKSLQSHSFLTCLSITSLWSHSHFTTVFLLFSNLFLPPLLFTFNHWFLSIHSNPLCAVLDPVTRLKRDTYTAAAFQRCFVCTNLPARLCQWFISIQFVTPSELAAEHSG